MGLDVYKRQGLGWVLGQTTQHRQSRIPGFSSLVLGGACRSTNAALIILIKPLPLPIILIVIVCLPIAYRVFHRLTVTISVSLHGHVGVSLLCNIA